ncbi:hypothetical protein KGO95_01275 [Patescibacteria group bacterium]|nr:hypothetical protein [Patescibacteria group bacterium]
MFFGHQGAELLRADLSVFELGAEIAFSPDALSYFDDRVTLIFKGNPLCSK